MDIIYKSVRSSSRIKEDWAKRVDGEDYYFSQLQVLLYYRIYDLGKHPSNNKSITVNIGGSVRTPII